jgi:nitrate reductase molybdenum cofactor assembly chaperone NarJ/NarW
MRPMGRHRPDPRVVYQVVSWCLDYPTPGLVERLPLLRAAVTEQSGSRGDDSLRRLFDHLGTTPLETLQREYVEVFDLSRHHALYLSYWTDGDTRRRGEVLARFKKAYRASGFMVDTHGELPDYLPMVLEFAACVDLSAGRDLLQTYRPSLELLRIALSGRQSPYAAALVAVCTTLPGGSPSSRAAVQAMVDAASPPLETVGLDPYDPRLLPLQRAGER